MIDPDLLAAVGPLAERFHAAGRRVFLVGGIVRDQLLGRPLRHGADIDLTTDARPDEVKQLVRHLASAVWAQGERFGTIGCRIDDRAYEITTHRGEAYDAHSRKPRVAYADAIEQDLGRRDFTVNAMAVELPDGELIDPFGGRADLVQHRLRTPLGPEASFSDDPLRMLRAARFIAGYGLTPDPELVAAVRVMGARLEIVSVERARDEIDKLLALDDPGPGLQFLVDTDLLRHALPAVAARSAVAVAAALARVVAVGSRPARLAALLHDPDAPAPVDVRAALRAMRSSNDDIRAVGRLADAWDMAAAHTGPWRDADVRDLARVAGPALDDVAQLERARGHGAALAAALDALRQREDLSHLEPVLGGDAVMALLDLPAGPEVGAALEELRRLRIEEGELGADEERRRLRAWHAARSSRRS